MFHSFLTTNTSTRKGSTSQAPPPEALRPQVLPLAKKVVPPRKFGYDRRTELSDSGHHPNFGVVLRRQLYSTAEDRVQLGLGPWTNLTSAMCG